MQTIDIILGVGETKVFQIGGAYFELIDGMGPVDVNFINAQGSRSKDLEMLSAVPGYWVAGPFAQFELKNIYPFAQVVRIMIGTGVGGSRRVQGQVSIADRIGSGAQNYSTSINALGFGTVALVAAAANVRGAIVSCMVLESIPGAGGSCITSIVAAPSAPANAAPTGVPAALMIYQNNTQPGVKQFVQSSDSRKLVPPGWGIWLCCLNGVTASAGNTGLAAVELL